MSEKPICPCEGFVHPKVISNPPGREVIEYRVGDFTAFRHALLLSRSDEQELSNTWQPSATGDLALQMVEWWAYLADILTFYNERIANETYLRTADLPESINHLINVLGYRPRPGIGARALVAALLNKQTTLTLPAGFQIQSKPGPGKQPQIFELEKATTIAPPDAVAVDPPPDASGIAAGNLLVKGAIASVKVDDELLVMKRGWNGADQDYAVGQVTSVQLEKDPRGKNNTRITLTYSGSGSLTNSSAGYRLLRSTQAAHLWPYPATQSKVIDSNDLTLDSLTRQIQVGDPVLIDPGASLAPIITLVVQTSEMSPTARVMASGSTARMTSALDDSSVVSEQGIASQFPTEAMASGRTETTFGRVLPQQLVSVTSYSEEIWYANAPDPSKPEEPPDPAVKPPISILHSRLSFNPDLDPLPDPGPTVVRYGWQEIGQLIQTPAKSFVAAAATLVAVSPATLPATASAQVMIEDANGNGVLATGATSGSPAASLQVSNLPAPPLTLTTPLRALFDVLAVSRGKSVPTEILGDGDATIPGQEFTLKKSPLTYLLSEGSASGVNYKSTLRVWVAGLEWTEVPSFYAQLPDAQVFVTREDDDHKTHVLFGDGINGARLPSGVSNVTGAYRYGSGAESPVAGSLTVILQPQPNLKAIRNPTAAGGGADPDPPQQIRSYAPRSVLTFGRAVSADDYETIAAQAPGVARARSYWIFDEEHQRALVKVYVGDDESARSAATIALGGAADPNRPIDVQLATPIPIQLQLTLRIDPRVISADVIAAARTVLVDPDAGLFGTNVVGIGQSVYRSQIYAACLEISGVLAVHSLSFQVNQGSGFSPDPQDFRHEPGMDGFFQLADGNLIFFTEQ